ncbi:MAG: IS630 family transposase [Chloroflexota bacterium]
MPRVGVANRPFPPLQDDPQAVTAAGLLELLAADPREHGHPQTRWTLAALRATVPRFAGASLSGIWRVLAACKLRWRRGRDHLHSPDPDYQRKRDRLRTIEAHVAEHPTSAELFYLDEVTYYRQPSLAAAYAPTGSATPLAERSTRGNTTTRVLAALNAHSGQVVSLQATRIGVPALLRFFKALVAAYPGRRLYIVLDNWPVHFHPDLLAALEPQQAPFPFFRPRSWSPEPSPKAKRLNLPIQLVQLPTYSPWLNPIEKLWRWLKQDVLHLHRLAHDLSALRALVLAFLARFQSPSPDLLRYVGL